MRNCKRNKVNRSLSASRLIGLLIPIMLVSNIILFGSITYEQGQSYKVYASTARKNDEIIVAVDKEAKRLESLYHKYRGKNWYCIGDNLTSSNLYQGKVRELCRMNIVVTDGQPGAGMATMVDHLTLHNLADIDLVTIFAGMYDFSGDTELGSINDDRTTKTFYGSVEKVIDRISTLNPNAKIVFITPLKIGKSKYGIKQRSTNPSGYELVDYVRAIKNVGNKHGIQVIDLYNQNGFDYNSLVSQLPIACNKLAEMIADDLERSEIESGGNIS